MNITAFRRILITLTIALLAVLYTPAQTTAFTYQGRLLDNNLPATASYDLLFRLWDSEIDGGGFGVVTHQDVPVSNGIFTVVLDFGNLFTGPERWLEISIRPAGTTDQYLTLSGRQRLTSAPYAIKSLNSDTATTALNLGGVPANQYVLTNSNDLLRVAGTRNVSAGIGAGQANVGNDNSFFGDSAGEGNTDGTNNTYVGSGAGESIISGSNNTFVGAFSGFPRTSGSFNSLFGVQARFTSDNLTHATAIGAGAQAAFSDTIQLGRDSSDAVRIGRLGSNGTLAVCLNSDKFLATCLPTANIKTNITDFSSGIDVIRKLRPVSFNWKGDNRLDVGLVPEEVAGITPLLVTHNEKGEVEGVKYDRIGVVLVNVVKEQQSQIEAQQKQIDDLKVLVCEIKPEANVCRKEGGK